MKRLIFFLLCLFILFTLHIQQAMAYSYGDPSEELVAEVYKVMAEELEKASPDFEAAEEAFRTVEEEVQLHMGSDWVEQVNQGLADEDKALTLQTMQKILVLNIARRLENVETNFEDYNTSRILLAKAYSTYEALSLDVREQDKALDEEIRKKFDLALEALGNPGLFGVGQKESDPDTFIETKDWILSQLQDYFQLESLDVGHFTEEDPAETGQPNKTPVAKGGTSNWLPLLVIVLVIVAVLIYTWRKRR
ncbi:MAG: hypothetical protein H0Z33_06025 [Bacillaceae bacterium]|nr:hypothetical protein [Bacillaceae bacterium]